MYAEEPWKGSVPEVYHKRTTDGSYLRVMDPNTPKKTPWFWSCTSDCMVKRTVSYSDI